MRDHRFERNPPTSAPGNRGMRTRWPMGWREGRKPLRVRCRWVQTSSSANLVKCKPESVQTCQSANLMCKPHRCKPDVQTSPVQTRQVCTCGETRISAVLQKTPRFREILNIQPGWRCNLQTCQPVQTSFRALTVARFCGAAPRSGRGAGRTRRPSGSTSVLVGQRCDGAKTTTVAMRKQPANPNRNTLQCG